MRAAHTKHILLQYHKMLSNNKRKQPIEKPITSLVVVIQYFLFFFLQHYYFPFHPK